MLAASGRARLGINANFYREDDRGFQDPIGLVVHNREMLAPPAKFYPTIGVLGNRLEWDSVTATVIAGAAVNGVVVRERVCRFNQPPTPKCAALYFGSAPKSLKNAIYLKAQGLGPGVGNHGYKTTRAPQDSDWVLFWSSKKLRGGAATQVSLDVRLHGKRLGAKWQAVTEAVSGSHVLTPSSVFPKLARTWTKSPQPRTLAGADAHGRGWVAVFDGRRENAKGVSVAEAWRFVRRELHAAWAVNLDGGGSSTLVYDGRLVNRPSDGSPRAVAAGWGAR